MIKAVAASRGIGIGSIRVIADQDLSYDPAKKGDPSVEKQRFLDAIESFKEKTTAIAADIRKRVGSKEADILEGHLSLIKDASMTGEMLRMIESGQRAEAAVEAVCDMFMGMFSKMDDDLMRQRASDIGDIKNSLLKLLLGIEDTDIKDLAPGTILVAKDLTPSQTSQIIKENVAGIITEVGGKTSHSAILARALEIPAVLSAEGITSLVKDKDTAIVDGTEGCVYINPEGDVLSAYIIKREQFIKKQAELSGFLGKKTETADGISLDLFCNIQTPRDANKALECDGEGIGLFRSEFLFMGRSHMPTEEEQLQAYKEAATVMKGKPVIIRTLDIGGDKDIPYLNIKKEDNPYLGYRGIRYCLGNRESFLIQLRAIIKASAFGKIKIMLPLVSCVDELREVKAMVADIKKDFDEQKIAYDKDIEIGCMIETPAASLIADILAKEADFLSIGTNDLTQYTMCIDRGNGAVAYLDSAFQPSVLRSIKHIIECGNKAGIPVGMCGEAAADPLMIPLLISFGLKEFSVNPVLVLTARCIISKWTRKEADALAKKVMAMDNEADIAAALKEAAKD